MANIELTKAHTICILFVVKGEHMEFTKKGRLVQVGLRLSEDIRKLAKEAAQRDKVHESVVYRTIIENYFAEKATKRSPKCVGNVEGGDHSQQCSSM